MSRAKYLWVLVAAGAAYVMTVCGPLRAYESTLVSNTLSLGVIEFDRATAREEGVDESALVARMGAEVNYAAGLAFGGGISGLLYFDEKNLNEQTQAMYAAARMSSSKARGYGIYIEGGVDFQLASQIGVSQFLGGEGLIYSGRRPKNCRECTVERIKLTPGFYSTTRVHYTLDYSITMGLAFRQYFSGDAEKSALLYFRFGY